MESDVGICLSMVFLLERVRIVLEYVSTEGKLYIYSRHFLELIQMAKTADSVGQARLWKW